jgi:heme-degrading monooxygenase HmoA
MAVAIVMDFEGGSLDQYDQVVQSMGLAPGGPTPPGALFHWVTQTDDGVRVTDVWESQDAFQAFAEEQIGPKTQAAGLAEPQLTFHEVHNHFIKS